MDEIRAGSARAGRIRRCLIATFVVLFALISVDNATGQGRDSSAESGSRGLSRLVQWGTKGREEDRAGTSNHRQAILDSLPLDRLTTEARERILSVAEKPTLFRQLPSQAIACDRDMFLFLTRNPDVLVGLWDLMGITQVQSRRTGPFQLEASDGAGTLCDVDLVYGDDQQHIFVVDGSYDGRMVPTPIRGKGVFILNSSYATAANGETTVSGTLDCFVQLESLGIDLIARTLSPIIGRSADSNFSQTAQFIAQVSQSSAHNPSAMLDIASRLPQVDPPIRKTFADTIVTVARRRESQQTMMRQRRLTEKVPVTTTPVQQSKMRAESVQR